MQSIRLLRLRDQGEKYHYQTDRERFVYRSNDKILKPFQPKINPHQLPLGYSTKVRLTSENIDVIKELPNYNRYWIDEFIGDGYNNQYWHNRRMELATPIMYWHVGLGNIWKPGRY